MIIGLGEGLFLFIGGFAWIEYQICDLNFVALASLIGNKV